MSKENDLSTPYSAMISWDAEAGVWYVSETNYPGLVAEADTHQGLVRKISSLMVDLCDANAHLVRRDHARGAVAIQLTVHPVHDSGAHSRSPNTPPCP